MCLVNENTYLSPSTKLISICACCYLAPPCIPQSTQKSIYLNQFWARSKRAWLLVVELRCHLNFVQNSVPGSCVSLRSSPVLNRWRCSLCWRRQTVWCCLTFNFSAERLFLLSLPPSPLIAHTPWPCPFPGLVTQPGLAAVMFTSANISFRRAT